MKCGMFVSIYTEYSKIILKGIILIINLNQYIIGIFVEYFGTGYNLIATLEKIYIVSFSKNYFSIIDTFQNVSLELFLLFNSIWCGH